jgi:hypothetical protein
MAIWYTLLQFGIFVGLFGKFVGYLVYFFRLGKLHRDKSGNPAVQTL